MTAMRAHQANTRMNQEVTLHIYAKFAEMMSIKVLLMQRPVSKLDLVFINQVRQRKSSARQESMVLVATRHVKTAVLASFKINQET